MWIGTRVERSPVVLDFTASAQGRHPTHALRIDDETILNAIDLVGFDSDVVQFVVCQSCGITQCEPGGWVALRRLGDAVACIPAFDAMASDALEEAERTPPAFMSRRGALLLRPSALAVVREAVPDFPAPDDLPPLSGRDAAQTIQWEAPRRALGRFPDPPALRSGAVAAVDMGALPERSEQLGKILDAAWQSPSPVSASPRGQTITFFLDAQGIPDWSPIALAPDGRLLLHLAPGLDVAVA